MDFQEDLVSSNMQGYWTIKYNYEEGKGSPFWNMRDRFYSDKINLKAKFQRLINWIVGLVQRNWGIFRYFYVENRNSMTLSLIIETYVSTNAALVYTDEWRAQLTERLRLYHHIVNLSQYFVHFEPF